jgi:hypothetical protein
VAARNSNQPIPNGKPERMSSIWTFPKVYLIDNWFSYWLRVNQCSLW